MEHSSGSPTPSHTNKKSHSGQPSNGIYNDIFREGVDGLDEMIHGISKMITSGERVVTMSRKKIYDLLTLKNQKGFKNRALQAVLYTLPASAEVIGKYSLLPYFLMSEGIRAGSNFTSNASQFLLKGVLQGNKEHMRKGGRGMVKSILSPINDHIFQPFKALIGKRPEMTEWGKRKDLEGEDNKERNFKVPHLRVDWKDTGSQRAAAA